MIHFRYKSNGLNHNGWPSIRLKLLHVLGNFTCSLLVNNKINRNTRLCVRQYNILYKFLLVQAKDLSTRAFIWPCFDISDLIGFSSRDDNSPNARGIVKNTRTSDSRAYFQFHALQSVVRKNAYCECCIRNNAGLNGFGSRSGLTHSKRIDWSRASESVNCFESKFLWLQSCGISALGLLINVMRNVCI